MLLYNIFRRNASRFFWTPASCKQFYYPAIEKYVNTLNFSL